MSIASPPLGTELEPPVGDTDDRHTAVTRKYVRGSTLLLGGRLISIVVNFAVQVLTVRYLSKSDYGAFAYALGAISMGSSAIIAGLDKSIPRFLPLYQARGDNARMMGAIALASSVIWGLGISMILVVYGARDFLQSRLVSDPQALGLLLALIALSPIEAFGTLLQNVLAVFAGARAIFIRRHVVGPLLKLGAVVAVMVFSGSVQLLAYGYLLGGALGVLLYISILVRVWGQQGLLGHLRWGRMTFPARELLGFSLPLFSSDVLVIVRSFLAAALLEYFHNTSAVAEYRAVLPIGRLNMLVFEAFAFLFIPLAARMYAKQEKSGIAELYWQTALVITVLTFPVFAVTFSLAEPLTLLLFGTRYQSSATVLAILAFGYYVHAALGFSTAVLRVHGRVRFMVMTDVIAASFAVGSGLLLIPRYGAVGAAISTAGTFILHNLLNQGGLATGGIGIRPLDRRFIRVYATVIVAALGLILVQVLFAPPIYAGVLLAVIASLLVVRLCRSALEPVRAFPELLRVPFVRQLVT